MNLPVEGELFDGKYRIGPVLGVGGMATVIAAKHTGFDEMVALKILLPDCCDDPAVVERFVQEGKTAIKIRSEHVVRMLDVGTVDGQAYLVMEYLDGKDLQALLRKGGPLPFTTAVDLLLQACQAIGEAHALGIVHRDLKPANLFLTHRADGSPCVKVLDFGISKMPRSASSATDPGFCPTLPSMVMGSPQYMSPEQMMSAAAADPRSDIWSLGTIL
jgi:serine/threonine protein kinase